MSWFFVIHCIETRPIVGITETAHAPAGGGSVATDNRIKLSVNRSISQFDVDNKNSAQKKGQRDIMEIKIEEKRDTTKFGQDKEYGECGAAKQMNYIHYWRPSIETEDDADKASGYTDDRKILPG